MRHIVICGLSGCHVFPQYLINSTIITKKLLNISQSKKNSARYCTIINVQYIGLYVKYSLFLTDINVT
jgi:hypothetical protein